MRVAADSKKVIDTIDEALIDFARKVYWACDRVEDSQEFHELVIEFQEKVDKAILNAENRPIVFAESIRKHKQLLGLNSPISKDGVIKKGMDTEW